jgi:hypothetical protein
VMVSTFFIVTIHESRTNFAENVNLGIQNHNYRFKPNEKLDITPLRGFQIQEWLYQFLSRISHHQPLSATK